MADEPDEIHRSDLAIDEIRENPAGRETLHLDEEFVRFVNEGADALDVTGWTVADEVGTTYRLPEETVLDSGQRVTLYSGRGTDTDSELYWGSDRPIWRNAGDTVLVRDTAGAIRIRESYNE